MANDFAPGSTPGNPAGFFAGSIREGNGANETLRQFAEAGGEIRRQTGLRLYGEVRNALANESVAGRLNPYEIPNATDYAPWTMGKGGEYVTSVNVFFRDRDTGVEGSKQYDYKTSVPHAPGEAELAAQLDYNDPDTADNYNQQFLGTTIRNVYVTSQFGG